MARCGGLSALTHGFFRRGFMLCDRCVLHTRCAQFEPGGMCAVEREAYDWVVAQLVEQYELEGLADEILAGRVAMYLIRIARAEAYESAMGVTDKLVLWGRYIRGLDNTLRGVMRDLAVTRAKRKQLEKGEELMVSLDELIHDSLVDLADHRYLDKSIARLLAGLLELLHAEEGLPPCHEYQCKLRRKSLHKKSKSDKNF